MEYTNADFITDLFIIISVDYFKSKPIPTNSYLWQVIRDTKSIDIVMYYIDKLPHDRAVYAAVINNKIDIADLLISRGVIYNPSELKFRSAESIQWAKKQGIDLNIEQIGMPHHYDINVIATLLSCYPQLLPNIDLCGCNELVLEYVLTNYNVVLTDKLIKYILSKGFDKCFVLIVSKINLHSYSNEIAKSSYDIVEYVTNNTNLTITDLGMSLFSGLYIMKKLEMYSSQIPDFITKAVECNLHQYMIDGNYTFPAFYLLQQYNICLPGLDIVGTAKVIINRYINLLLNCEFTVDKDIVYEYKAKVDQATTMSEILQLYEEL